MSLFFAWTFFLISVSTVAHITLMMAKAKHVFMQGRLSTYIRSTRVSLRKKNVFFAAKIVDREGDSLR